MRAVTVKNIKHPRKSVLPQNAPIDNLQDEQLGERSCLKCKRNEYDPDLQYTYFLISDEERGSRTKE